jgi:hypothetical protein
MIVASELQDPSGVVGPYEGQKRGIYRILH